MFAWNRSQTTNWSLCLVNDNKWGGGSCQRTPNEQSNKMWAIKKETNKTPFRCEFGLNNLMNEQKKLFVKS